MAYTYTSWVTQLANLLVVASTDVGFQTMLPGCIDDVEQRCYRELDLLNTVVRDSSTSFVAGARDFNLPAANGTFYVVDSIYAITPAGQTTANAGTRNELVPASRPFINSLFPSSTGSSVPGYFAMQTQTSIIVGPWPDQNYQMEVVGTIRPPVLSSTNLTTLLTVYFPDLWMAGTMIFGAAYQLNFGTVVDNPQQGVTWSSHFDTLLKSAEVEEARKKFTSQGWSSKQPAQLATPPRT